KVFDGPASPITSLNGRPIISLSSNNVLAMSINPIVLQAAENALKKYGTTCGGSRLISGNLSIQLELENKLAAFLGMDNALAFMTGYMANQGVILALTNTDTLLKESHPT